MSLRIWYCAAVRAPHDRLFPVVFCALKVGPLLRHSDWDYLFEGYDPRVMDLHPDTTPEDVKKLYDTTRRAYNEQKIQFENRSGQNANDFSHYAGREFWTRMRVDGLISVGVGVRRPYMVLFWGGACAFTVGRCVPVVVISGVRTCCGNVNVCAVRPGGSDNVVLMLLLAGSTTGYIVCSHMLQRAGESIVSGTVHVFHTRPP